jgi:hypothetical protein
MMFVIMRHSFAPCIAAETDPVRYLECAIDLSLAGLRKDPRGVPPYTE